MHGGGRRRIRVFGSSAAVGFCSRTAITVRVQSVLAPAFSGPGRCHAELPSCSHSESL